MANKTPTVKEQPSGDTVAEVKWQAVVDTWDAIYHGYRLNLGTDPEMCPIEWRTHGLRVIAEKLKVPYFVALLLNEEITADDLEQWAAWPAIERAALLKAAREEE